VVKVAIEIRVCPYDRSRVSIIATGRKLRPKQYVVSLESKERGVCPFCPGYEFETPPATLVYTMDYKFSYDTVNVRVKNWLVRVFPNKYPALNNRLEGVKGKVSAYGFHEVLVETPLHSEREYLKTHKHIYYSLLTLRERVKLLLEDPLIEHITIIKNSGVHSGASIVHPHLQLFANTFTPPIILNEIQGFKTYIEEYNECPLCSIVKSKSERTILDTNYFRVETRYTPKQSYELIIIPKNHKVSILEANDDELKDLAHTLTLTIRTLKDVLGDVDYNYWFHIAPKGVNGLSYHWHLEIQPLIETWGGYEKGSGVHIVTISPEEAAKTLRDKINYYL